MTLSMLAEETNAQLLGSDVMFSRISTDTRSLSKGDLYLALLGENFDGNKFVSEAEKQGACAAITSVKTETQIPVLRVVDTHKTLGKIANLNRQRSDAKVIALTGSQGKTTVKEMLGAILNISADCLVTKANLNNTIGVPFTLLDINEAHQFVVIEMGADSAGEISFSTNITQPDIALITNASPAHIEGFGSLQGIVAAKGEIIEGLSEQGVVILNADDQYCSDWEKKAGDRRVVKFSFENELCSAAYHSSDVKILDNANMKFCLQTPIGSRDIETNFLGKHNVLNAVAASAAAIEAGASLDDVVKGLSTVLPVPGRLCPGQGISGSVLIDDSYNASPSSFRAAIDVLMAMPAKKILIAGEMKELGVETETAHSEVGEYAAKSGVDELWATGEKCKLMVESFGAAGRYFPDKASLIQAGVDLASSDIVFLVKGSRGSRMDTVVNELTDGGEN